MADFNSTKRLIAKLLRDLIRGNRFAEYADLRDALRRRLGRLRIRYRPADFDDAITTVQSNAALVDARGPSASTPQLTDERPLTSADAAAILSAVRHRLNVNTGPKRMPFARPITRQQAAALAVALDAMRAAEVRCDALEREVDQGEPSEVQNNRATRARGRS